MNEEEWYRGSIVILTFRLIMVTHRLTAIEQFDELFVIDEAKLIEKGTYAELLQLEKGFFKQLVERV